MTRRSIVVLSVLLSGVAACGDGVRSASPTAPHPPRPATNVVAGTCTTPENLLALVDTVFGPGTPNYNSARGKTENLIMKVSDGLLDVARDQAFNTVDFTLKVYRVQGLIGTEAQVLRLVNGLLCYAGLDIQLSNAGDSYLIYPSDSAQSLVTGDGNGGVHFDANPVSEPTLVTLHAVTPSEYVPGLNGPLDTKLDQYPGYLDIEKQSETNAPLPKPAIVAVCLTTNVDPAIAMRLRLGHQKAPGTANFEITPAVDPALLDFLNCPDPSTFSSLPGWLRSVADLVLPKTLYAAARALSGGIGGSAGEFSPFGAVDTQLSTSGGIGGSAGEFMRSQSNGLSLDLVPDTACTTVEAPIGTALPANCRPSVSIHTARGTVLNGVPVHFAVTGGGGVLGADVAGVCGTLADTATVPTVEGTSRACWTMGPTAGANTATATPAAGGDAPVGVSFVPATINFLATANPPSQISIDQQPSNITAGGSVTMVASARDHNGVVALGWSGNGTATLNQHTFASGSATATVTFTNGVAAIGPLQINTADTAYRITVSATFPPAPPATTPVTASTTSDAFTVSPAAAFGLRIVSGNGQTAAAGSTVPLPPTVGVRDAYGNDVPGATIAWTATLSSTASVNPATSVTDASGLASTAWTLGPDKNELVARLTRTAMTDTVVVFTATGTVTLVVVDDCLPGGSGDPFTDPTKPYGFWIPNPGNNRAVRQVTLYISAAGRASDPTDYLIALDVRVGSWNGPLQTITAPVTLRGNSSEFKPVTFTFATPVIGAGGGPAVFMRLRQAGGPVRDNAPLTFNTGPCSPGTSCRPPSSCQATEVTTFPPYDGSGPVPTGTTYRKSVAVRVKG